MKVVLDTNVLLTSLPSRSSFHRIIQAFKEQKYRLMVTNDVLLEYEEILSIKANPAIARNILDSFNQAPNVFKTFIYYSWNLISSDPDDNKFIDAYLNGGADYLVTNDAHFSILKTIDFPRVNVLSPNEFLKIL